ncbi:MAG: VWA domain-containing protein [Alistipes sp.]|nr:VWA domain-containing protein [Alistipes sp.]
MKNIIKKIVALVAIMVSYTSANAQQETPLAYLEKTYPQLTELFRDELNNYNAHYIFAIDVSGSMKQYQDLVANALTPFFQALPDKDRVHIIPFGTEAETTMLGYFGIIDSSVKQNLCRNIKTLYTDPSYSKEFRGYTDIPRAVEGVAQVMQNNREYKANIVVMITDFRNDQKGSGEHKISSADLEKMKSAIKAATGDVYTRFIALQLPVDTAKPGYCVDQLQDVFSFDDHKLEVISVNNGTSIIEQWFDQLKRDIMITKLRAIVRSANKESKVNMDVDMDIDGNVTAEITWEPSKLYPTIKIDSASVAANGFTFNNNTEAFVETTDTVINLELGQVVHENYGFHTLNDDLALNLTLPTPYDEELNRLEIVKPLPATSIPYERLVFTFIFTLKTTIIILALLILYIIGVFKAMARNRKLCFQGTVTIFDAIGTQLGDVVRITNQAPSAVLTFGKGGSPRCQVNGANWQFVISKKKGNPFLVFQKPCFVWKATQKYVASGKSQSGVITDILKVKCGDSVSQQTHSVKVKLIK